MTLLQDVTYSVSHAEDVLLLQDSRKQYVMSM